MDLTPLEGQQSSSTGVGGCYDKEGDFNLNNYWNGDLKCDF